MFDLNKFKQDGKAIVGDGKSYYIKRFWIEESEGIIDTFLGCYEPGVAASPQSYNLQGEAICCIGCKKAIEDRKDLFLHN